jgi:acylphosphatase
VPELNTTRVRVVVSGRVQGVGFRWYTRDEAARRGVAGWVRNLPDGRVEATFEGDDGAVESMVVWCGHGPRGADVRAVERFDERPSGAEGFRITA